MTEIDTKKYEGHSPGPWSACHDGKCRCKQVWATDHPVATVESGTWGDSFPTLKMTGGSFDRKVEAVIERIEYGEIDEAVAEANCKLIAAAPDLYEALERMTRLLKDNYQLDDLAEQVITKAIAALKKAGGE